MSYRRAGRIVHVIRIVRERPPAPLVAWIGAV
jgi:hypothetical protein